MNNEFECLLQRGIVDILIGDKILGEKLRYTIRMPYSSGSDLGSLFQQFGLSNRNMLGSSRWFYMDSLLKHTNKTSSTDKLLAHLFSFEHFRSRLSQLYHPQEMEDAHREIVKAVMSGINSHLFFNKKELRKNAHSFQVVPVGTPEKMECEYIDAIDLNYIHQLSSRIRADLNGNQLDRVLAKSQVLVEEVLIHILEEKRELNIPRGGFSELFSRVKKCFNLQQHEKFDGRINSMLSGLENIMQAVIEMRNAQNSSTGAGTKRISIRAHEAQLVVNSAIAFADYVFSVYAFQAKNPVQ